MHARAGGSEPQIEPLGETCLLLRFGTHIDSAVNARVHAAAAILHAAQLPGVVDIVPAYASLALVYAPAAWAAGDGAAWRHLAAAVQAVFAIPPVHVEQAARTLEIAVHYGGNDGPDLDEVARHCDLSLDAVIERHAGGKYRVAMLGFAPGFAYLTGLDPALCTPRRADPRQRVAAGSIAIGGLQTGIYPAQLPGGWQLIGRTPRRLFDLARDPPCLLAAGDCVRFRAIGAEEFVELERQAER